MSSFTRKQVQNFDLKTNEMEDMITEKNLDNESNLDLRMGNLSNQENNQLQASGLSKNTSYRSIDDFLDESYNATSPGNRLLYYLIIISIGIANSSDATEILFISFILSNPSFEKDILKDDVIGNGGIVAASVFSGMLVGGAFTGTFSDKYGRKPTLLFGLLVNSLMGAFSAISPNVEVLTFTRFMTGTGIGISVPPLFALISELSPPSKRGEFITYVASFWMIGSLYVALTAMWLLGHEIAGWRVFAVVAAFPSFLAFFMVHFFVPESPRFLAITGRHTEAISSTNSIAIKMGRSRFDMKRSRYQLEELNFHFQSFLNRNNPTATNNWENTKENIRHLYARNAIQSTIAIQTVWFSLSFGSYGLIIWINSIFTEINPESVYVNALIFAASNLPGNILSAVLLDQVGRKIMLAMSMLASALSLGFFALFSSDKFLSSSGVIVCACLFQAFSTSAWNTIDVLSSESFPTQIRSTGMGSCTVIGRIAAMLAQPINSFLIDKPVILLSVGCIAMLIGGVTPLACQIGDLTGKPLIDHSESNYQLVHDSKQLEATDERTHILS